jgi:hypothetical protein
MECFSTTCEGSKFLRAGMSREERRVLGRNPHHDAPSDRERALCLGALVDSPALWAGVFLPARSG